VNVANIMERLEMLEETVRALRTLPERLDRVDAHIVPLEERTSGEFAALRAEMHALHQAGLCHAERLRDELRDELRREMRALNEEARRHALVLHEDLVNRIRTLGEGLPARRPKRRS
jgi:hypothetical protein